MLKSQMLDPWYIFSGPAKSHEFNDLIKAIQSDLDILYSIHNINADNILKALYIYAEENKALKQQINDITSKYEELQANLESVLDYNGIKVMHSILHDAILTNAHKEYGLITLPVASISDKLTYNGVIPKDLAITIEESKDGVNYYDIDTSYEFIQSIYWMRRIDIPISQAPDIIYSRITIKVPASINNNMLANVLKLIPCADTQIESVTYTTKQSSGQISYDGIMTIFPEQTITELTVVISNHNYTDSPEYRTFAYGLKYLGLYYYDFLDTGSFVVPFDISNMSAYFKSIKEPKEPGDYELYIDDNLRLRRQFDTELYNDLKKVYIKVNMTKSDSIPIYRHITLPFYVRMI